MIILEPDWPRYIHHYQFKPGNIDFGLKYSKNTYPIKFPVEDTLVITWSKDNHEMKDYTFNVFNFVLRGSVRSFDIHKFADSFVRASKRKKTSVRYNKYKFALSQIEQYNTLETYYPTSRF